MASAHLARGAPLWVRSAPESGGAWPPILMGSGATPERHERSYGAGDWLPQGKWNVRRWLTGRVRFLPIRPLSFVGLDPFGSFGERPIVRLASSGSSWVRSGS